MIHLTVRQRIVVNRAVGNLTALLNAVVGESVLHPVLVITVRKVLASVRTARFFTSVGTVHRLTSLSEKVVKLESFDQISVPHKRLVRDLHVTVEAVHDLVDLLHTLVKRLLSAENSSVVLHGPLHLEADVRGRRAAFGVEEPIDPCNSLVSNRFRDRWERGTRFENILAAESTSTSKDNNVKERVGSKPIGSVNGRRGSLTSRHKSGNDGVFVFFSGVDNLHTDLVTENSPCNPLFSTSP